MQGNDLQAEPLMIGPARDQRLHALESDRFGHKLSDKAVGRSYGFGWRMVRR